MSVPKAAQKYQCVGEPLCVGSPDNKSKMPPKAEARFSIEQMISGHAKKGQIALNFWPDARPEDNNTALHTWCARQPWQTCKFRLDKSMTRLGLACFVVPVQCTTAETTRLGYRRFPGAAGNVLDRNVPFSAHLDGQIRMQIFKWKFKHPTASCKRLAVLIHYIYGVNDSIIKLPHWVCLKLSGLINIGQ